MKKYIFTIDFPNGELVPIIAKNIQSAIAKLCLGGFYTEDQIKNIEIVKNIKNG